MVRTVIYHPKHALLYVHFRHLGIGRDGEFLPRSHGFDGFYGMGCTNVLQEYSSTCCSKTRNR